MLQNSQYGLVSFKKRKDFLWQFPQCRDSLHLSGTRSQESLTVFLFMITVTFAKLKEVKIEMFFPSSSESGTVWLRISCDGGEYIRISLNSCLLALRGTISRRLPSPYLISFECSQVLTAGVVSHPS
jgi:hypothetical protein